jgi:hypothetical protein
MIRRLAHLTLLTALMLSIGGQWALIQSAAWAGMFFKYVKHDTVAEALSKTFDGQHPCRLCKAVTQGTSGTKPDPSKSPAPMIKINLLGQSTETALVQVSPQRTRIATISERARPRSEAPEAPPPRAV